MSFLSSLCQCCSHLSVFARSNCSSADFLLSIRKYLEIIYSNCQTGHTIVRVVMFEPVYVNVVFIIFVHCSSINMVYI